MTTRVPNVERFSSEEEEEAILDVLLAKAPRYDDLVVVPFKRDEGGGFQRRGGPVLAVVHDPDLLILLDFLWRSALSRRMLRGQTL